MDRRVSDKAASCGEPSYVWRAGQERRLQMVREAAGDRLSGRVLENGCGIGTYLRHLAREADQVIGLEYDFERAEIAGQAGSQVVNAAGECLPFKESIYDLILSHEVLEHVYDDRAAVLEMARVLRDGGRAVIFVPNRGYPFETHGIFWRGKYRFGNIPLVNYLPKALRDRLAPHVRVYGRRDLEKLFTGLPVMVVEQRVIFGAYDNIIARFPRLGASLRGFLQRLENTPWQALGLSHFVVIEKRLDQLRKS
jgi:SAM-dependent methyltransferase